MIQEKITPDFYKARVDVWARHKWPHIPYASLQKAIRKGMIKVDGKKTQACARLESCSVISFKEKWPAVFHAPQKDLILGDAWKKKIKTWILYEDKQMIVLNKPSGIACQGGSGQKIHVDGLMQSWCGGDKIRLVHRLDRATSGVLVLAKTLQCARILSDAFCHHRVKKMYWAFVQGCLPSKGTIDTSIQRMGRIMTISQSPEAQKSLTRYVCRGQEKGRSWAEIYPVTGRMHQIRVHMASIGHPVQGDDVYGVQGQGEALFLHCRQMSWTMKGKHYTFVAPCPEYFCINGQHLT